MFKKIIMVCALCITLSSQAPVQAASSYRLLSISDMHPVDWVVLAAHPVNIGLLAKSKTPPISVLYGGIFLLEMVHRGVTDYFFQGDEGGDLEFSRGFDEIMLAGLGVAAACQRRAFPQLSTSYSRLFSVFNGGVALWHTIRACDRFYRSYKQAKAVHNRLHDRWVESINRLKDSVNKFAKEVDEIEENGRKIDRDLEYLQQFLVPVQPQVLVPTNISNPNGLNP